MKGHMSMNPQKRAAVLALCFVVTVLEGYDLQSMGVAVPYMAPDLGLSTKEIGIALSATMVGLMAGASFGGWLADRLGAGKVLAFASLIFGLATLMTVFAQDVASLATMRIATGIGVGAALPNVMALLTASIPPERRAFHGMAIFCGFPLGAIFAALVLKIWPDLPWQGIFLIGGVPPILLAPFIWRIVAGPQTGAVPTLKGEPDNNPMTLLFGGGRALLTLTIWAAFCTVLLLLYLFMNWLPALIVAQGFAPSAGASAVLSFNVGSIIGALILGYCVDRFGLRWPSLVAFVILGLSITWLGKVADIPMILLASALVGSTVVGSQFVLYSISAGYYPEWGRGLGGGAAVAVGRLGAIIGPLAVGFLLADGMTGQDIMLSLTPFVVLAGIAFLVLSVFKTEDAKKAS
jgi:MFS transporter, AAHS family, 3-hydroxyphenylpropionic acid transporter